MDVVTDTQLIRWVDCGYGLDAGFKKWHPRISGLR